MGILLVSHCNHTHSSHGALAYLTLCHVQPKVWRVRHTCCMRLGVLMMLQLHIWAA